MRARPHPVRQSHGGRCGVVAGGLPNSQAGLQGRLEQRKFHHLHSGNTSWPRRSGKTPSASIKHAKPSQWRTRDALHGNAFDTATCPSYGTRVYWPHHGKGLGADTEHSNHVVMSAGIEHVQGLHSEQGLVIAAILTPHAGYQHLQQPAQGHATGRRETKRQEVSSKCLLVSVQVCRNRSPFPTLS